MSSSFRATGARAGQGSLRALLVAVAACLGTGLLVAACSGAASTSAGSGAAAPVPGGLAHRAADGPAFGSAKSAGQAGSSARLELSTQSIIYTAQLTDHVKNVAAAADAATSMVTAVGGYVSSEQEFVPPGPHAMPQISLELKIPVAQYGPTLAKLRAPAFGKPVSFSTQTENVTQQVADVSSRVGSAQAAISQLRALLKRAGSVSELLSVQNEINSQESALEALLAQQSALAHETSYGTVSVTLVGHHARIVKKHKTVTGFTAGLRNGWHALVLVVDWVLTALGSVLPFAIPVVLLGGIAFESRRRLARHKNPPAADPPAAATS